MDQYMEGFIPSKHWSTAKSQSAYMQSDEMVPMVWEDRHRLASISIASRQGIMLQ